MSEQKPREANQAAKLPNRSPDRTWGGSGSGAACAICGAPVKSDELEFELEFRRDDGRPGLDKYQVHVRCFRPWELERQSRALPLPEVVSDKITDHAGAGFASERR